MTVLMTEKKANAIISVERDKHLLTDKAASERIIETEPEADRKALTEYSNSKEYLEFRMKNG